MIMPLNQLSMPSYGSVHFAVTRAERKAERRERRRGGVITTPPKSPTPFVDTKQTTTISPRQERRIERKAKRGGILPAVISAPVNGDIVSVSDRRRVKEERKARRTMQRGGVAATIAPDYSMCMGADTLGTCLQCCSHNFEGSTRRRCKRECDNVFKNGRNGGGGGCVTGKCSAGYCDTGTQCCPDPRTAGPLSICRPYPSPAPAPPPPGNGIPQDCGIVCVSGTSGQQQDCHWECHDYGIPPDITPTTTTPMGPPAIYGPMDSFLPLGGEEPIEQEVGLFEQYKLPIIVGAVALTLGYVFFRKKR